MSYRRIKNFGNAFQAGATTYRDSGMYGLGASASDMLTTARALRNQAAATLSPEQAGLRAQFHAQANALEEEAYRQAPTDLVASRAKKAGVMKAVKIAAVAAVGYMIFKKIRSRRRRFW